ncbi:hypothetical protein SPRG_05946 [Saprolegnia parasitica CBS 223.65]|uniref:Uncharacterized protein n=1 Tax=Saprolegnia parasitica (strain CBS 223.65) TaxID=695850 RepID=A0A067CF69_SAPPC|nr:hypothetical protein SPRG_05946 [Saprolegnia parasitica CBS 223.65]KDO29409.1 hypothetical protein SPRG_05946 [Saprolegnia parasitica CBS 223.65]|eukprot:XP_012199911.1 hypothetical protein SPRG_05946 [Saprolegnia parasitica CBS 223.65]
MDHVFTIKSLYHQPGPQTSINLYWAPYNDWDVSKLSNMSLVRYSDNWIGPTDWEELDQLLNATGGLSEPLATFHDRVGPYVSIDLYLVDVPSSVMTIYVAFQALLGNATVPTSSLVVAPTPPAWEKTPYAFMGGNPACLSMPRFTPYVQHPFSYTDDCSGNAPFTINMTTHGMLFARLWDSANASAICALTADAPACARILSETATSAPDLALASRLLADAATDDMAHTNASLMQFAIDGTGTWRLLRQPLMAPPSDAWTFFGWLLVHDWILGRREVVAFEGDVSSIVLISDAYEPLVYPTSGGDRYMEVATRYIAHLITTSVFNRVLVAVVVVCVCVLSRGAVDGSSLAFFSRVVGSVWSGRPLIFLQGMTAIVILSTAQLTLVQTAASGVTQLRFAPRPLWRTAIIAGEATWVCYVLQEVLLVAVGGAVTRAANPYSTAFVWATFLLLDGLYPVAAIGTLSRTCVSYDMDYQVDCRSGNLRIGDMRRVLLLVSIAVGVPLGSIVLARYWRKTPRVAPVSLAPSTQLNLHMCGISQALLTLRMAETSHDDIAYFLSGILTWTLREQRYLFDIKTWIFVDPGRNAAASEPWTGPSLEPPAPQEASGARRMIVSVAALAYLGATIAASISYIQVSAVNLANDFYWPRFNSSGTHVFLASWINTQLVLNRTHQGPFQLTSSSVNLFSAFNATAATVPAVLNYAAKLQHDAFATRLDAIVAGLRALDGCDGPWVFTPYCYLDLERRWEMANSATRQARCSAMTTNGAIYLETLVRNVDAPSWRTCWGDAFDVAIGSELRQSQAGRAWLGSAYLTRSLAIADEVTYWQDHGITYYDTQWQNYKQLGMLNSYSIVNCYDATYPLTLQAQNGSYRFSSQTSWKMYWALANDLSAVMRNESGLHGLSLLRSSARYGFANQSMEAVLMQSGELTAPFTAGFALVSDVLGPFGSVDMIYVSVPRLLQETFADLLDALRSTLRTEPSAQELFSRIAETQRLWPVPPAWWEDFAYVTGGSLLCLDALPPGYLEAGLTRFTSFSMSCNGAALFLARLRPSREQFVLATLLAQLSPASNVSEICAIDVYNVDACTAYIGLAISMQVAHPSILISAAAVAAARNVVGNVSFAMFAQSDDASPVVLATLPLFNAPAFDVYTWLYLSDWVLGKREVVSFQGDQSAITVLLEPESLLQQPPNAWQVLSNVALYTRAGVLYITCVLLGVAVVVTCYILASRGAFEWLNMFELSRVGGIVWVGRPLLLLRATTALSVLSTATLELLYEHNAISAFQTVQNPWYTTLLAASEVTWLVAVVNDVAMALTQAYTAHYATFNSVAVWATVALLSFVSPVTHTVSLQPVCDLVQLDWQIVCASGHIVIGQWSRYVALVTIVVGWNGASYVSTRLWLRQPPPTHGRSVFLSCGAKYLFEHRQWTHGGVYYLDRASAVLTGLLTLRWRRQLYVFDVKLWRIFALAAPALPVGHPWTNRLQEGIPLLA